jgi:hypothetical protein
MAMYGTCLSMKLAKARDSGSLKGFIPANAGEQTLLELPPLRQWNSKFLFMSAPTQFSSDSLSSTRNLRAVDRRNDDV